MKKSLAKLGAADVLSVLLNPPFLYFSLSVIFSQIASNMFNIVMIFLIYYLTSSNLSVSILILSFLIPQIFLSFFGGIVADQKNKKKILIFGNLGRALVVLLLFFFYGSVPLVLLITLIVAVATQFYVPAETPMIPHLVKKEQLLAANGIFGVCFFGSVMIGYVLAGPLIGWFGRDGVFLFLSALFLTSAISATLIPTRLANAGGSSQPLSDEVKKSIKDELKASYYILKNSSEVGLSLMFLVFSQVGILIIATVIPGYAEDILKIPPEDLSVILFGPAAGGMIISALLVGSVFATVKKNILITIGIFLTGLVLCIFPFTSQVLSRGYIELINSFLPSLIELTTIHMVVFLAFVSGVGNAFVFVPSQTTIQEKVPENFRSKIYGLLFALIGIFSLAPILLAGTLADILGVGTVLIGLGVLIIIIGLTRIGISPTKI